MDYQMINPVKTSPAIGAAFAIQGIKKAMPLYHAPPGCTFLSKVLLTQHFREPVAIMGSDTKEISTVFGSSEELKKKAEAIIEKNKPDLIYIISSTTAEIRGEETSSLVTELELAHPSLKICHIDGADYSGGFAEGFARVVLSTLQYFAKKAEKSNKKKMEHVTVLPAPFMTVGDITLLKEILISSGLTPLVLPDLSRSMDGSRSKYSAMAHDGTEMEEIENIFNSSMILSFSKDLAAAGEWLSQATGAEHHNIETVYGMKATDQIFSIILGHTRSDKVFEKWNTERLRLKDLMVDTHLHLGGKKCAIALEQHHTRSFTGILEEVGVEFAAYGPVSDKKSNTITPGSLYNIENELMHGTKYDLLISNSHGKALSDSFSIPLVRAGFPVYDHYGANLETRIGYQGAINLIREIANIV